MVICAKGHEIAYFIYQKGFSDLHGLTDKYDSHKDLICLVFKDNTIKPIPQLNTVNIQIQILDMGLESDFISSVILGRYSVSMVTPPEVCKIENGDDFEWVLKEGTTTYLNKEEVPLKIASRTFNRNVGLNPLSRSSPILSNVGSNSTDF